MFGDLSGEVNGWSGEIGWSRVVVVSGGENYWWNVKVYMGWFGEEGRFSRMRFE